MTARTVLVTDGQERAALAVVRSLGRRGHAVHVVSSDGRSLAGASRYVRREWRAGDPLATPQQFADDVQAIISRERVDVLLPISEAALLALLPRREALSGLLPFPRDSTFRRISDKEALLIAAPAAGISVPDQRAIRTRDEAATVDAHAFEYPVVLKPARSVSEHNGQRAKVGVLHASGARALRDALASLDASAYPVLVQQRIVGPGIGIFLLLWEGEVIARFAHRRIREKPPSGGVSVYRESVPADDVLVERSRALLETFGWCGVAMVEYKVDARSGTPYLMEVNGRFWGSLQLAIDAGVDFPALLLACALGEHPAPVVHYRTGVRSRWWWGDVDHLLARLRNSDAALPSDAPSRWRAVRDFCTLWRADDRNEVLRLDDPRPFLRETAQWFRAL